MLHRSGLEKRENHGVVRAFASDLMSDVPADCGDAVATDFVIR